MTTTNTTTDQAYVHKRVAGINDANLSRLPNKWLMEFPAAHDSRMVLDIACGMGYDSIAWARAGKVPVGIDFNFGLVKAASELAKRLGLEIHFVVADSTRLPFRKDSFDVSFSENLFEHVPQWQSIVDEVHSVLREDGLFFVRTSNRLCPRNPEINHLRFYPWFPEFMKKPILAWVMKHRPSWVNFTKFPAVNWFTHRSLAGQFQRTGFETYEIFDMVRTDNLSRRAKRMSTILDLLKRYKTLRYAAYPLMRSTQILAVKKA
jgi:2-polyprenyl-3-methyl-5-hydroxy-6-metoxy-1,4-benzoquinol methylase